MQPNQNSAPQLARLSYTLGQFCEVTGLSRTAAYQAIASGELMTFKHGKRRYVRATAAEAWLTARERHAALGCAAVNRG